jgi:hypothetical protein
LTTTLAAGTHSITAQYLGGGDHAASTSAALSQRVTIGLSSTTLTNAPLSSTFGESVLLTANVTTPAAPTGSVAFFDGLTYIGSGAVDGSGQATLAITSLAVGSHSLTAVYDNDTNYSGSTSPVVTHVVSASGTSTTLGTSGTPANAGTAVTFTAVVSPQAPGAGTPTGSVTFFDGASPIGTVSLDGTATAALTTSTLIAGTHDISAQFLGTSSYTTSTSPHVSQQIAAGITATALISSVNPSRFGQSITLTATISGTPAPTTGSVTFRDGITSIGSAPVTGAGNATLSIATLSSATHSLTAVYSGNAYLTGSTSTAVSQLVNPASTSVAISSSLNPSAPGEAVNLTAVVTAVAPGSGTPTGSVTFFDGATSLATVALTAGSASLSTTTLSLGAHSITASFGGSTNFATSTSVVMTQTVRVTAPQVASMSATTRCQGSAGFSLTLTGSNFQSGAIVRWNGASRATQFVSATQLIATIPASDLAAAGSIAITVLNPDTQSSPNSTFGVIADITAPVVTAPANVVVLQTSCSGTIAGTTGADPAIAAFLSGAVGADGCSTTSSLAPQLNGVDILPATFIPAGLNVVTFRQRDGAGNIGSSTATLRVALAGDVTLDGKVTASDLVVMANYLVGNIHPGDGVFNAPLGAAKLNSDANVNALDLVVLGNFMVDNIHCLPLH